MVAMGTLAALTLPAYNLTFDFMSWFLGAFARTLSGYVGFNLLSQLIAALIMIPATFCAGMTLPLLTHELMRRGAGERAIGTVYSANTLGRHRRRAADDPCAHADGRRQGRHFRRRRHPHRARVFRGCSSGIAIRRARAAGHRGLRSRRSVSSRLA